MTAKANYIVPAFLMGAMLAAIIYLIVVYPAKSYVMENAAYNAPFTPEGQEYKERKQYTDLQLKGREIYIREGCFYCHSQQARYQDRGMGPSMRPQEYQWDSPHTLGSARTGPDLSREGGKYPSRWHREHHINPRSKYAGSIMPSFEHLDERELVFGSGEAKGETDPQRLLAMSPADLRATPEFNETDGRLTRAEALHELRAIGYTDYDIVKMDGRGVTELDALGAYIQSLGPNRMYEPGGRVSMVEGQTLPADTRYALDGHPGDSDPQPAAAPGNDDRPDDAAHAMLVQNREPRGLPEGVDPPPDWAGLAEMHATYWAPNEYEDLVTIAKEENKIPAFEARFITNGRGIYLGKCAHCHGLNGQGNGPAGRYMMKKPANFWLPQFKLYDDAMWFYRIVEGVPGTEMPVWKYSLKQRKHSAQWDQVWYLVTYLKYVAANSPMEQVPYDLPPEYYMTDQERSRKAIFPVDPAVVNQLKAQAEAKSEAQDTATEGYEGPPVTAPEPREREDARSAAPQDVEGER